MIDPITKAHWVRSPEGIWYVLNGRYESPIMSTYLQPFITELLTNVFNFLGKTLEWEDDVDDESGRLV